MSRSLSFSLLIFFLLGQRSLSAEPESLQVIAGTCRSFNHYVKYTGVAAPDAEGVVRNFPDRAGRTIAPEYTYEWSDLAPSNDPNNGQHCISGNLRVKFETLPPFYVIKWKPPIDASTQCLDEVERFDQHVRTHEGVHQEDDEELIKPVNEAWKDGKPIKACAATESEAAAAFEAEAKEMATSASRQLGVALEAKGEELHDGDPAYEPLNCALCPGADHMTYGRITMRAKIDFEDRLDRPLPGGAQADTHWKLYGDHEWKIEADTIELLSKDAESRTYRLKGTVREQGSGNFSSREVTTSKCPDGSFNNIFTISDAGTLAKDETNPNWTWDVTIRGQGPRKTYSFIVPERLSAPATGSWHKRTTGCGSYSDDGDRNGAWSVTSSQPPYTPIEGSVEEDGAVRVSKAFRGAEPWFVRFNFFNPYPRSDGSFPVELTIEAEIH